jgi:HK97 family phage major capsid protein
LTLTDTPLAVQYGKEIVELVATYGDARKYCTVYPLGANTVKLPRLKTDPAFGFIDMSGTVPDKNPQYEYVDFTPLKAGGIIRIPSEIDSDSIIAMGQWLAKYIARQFAKWEDETTWNADGSGTYKTRKGMLLKADELSKKLTLTTGNTSTDDVTLANLRLLRGLVDVGALNTAAYYFHPTMDGLLSTFNASGTNPYTIMDGKPKLDGYPVRWVSVMQPFSSTSTPNKYAAAFGAMEYWGFGERQTPEIAISKDIYFVTDEIGMRALERFDIGLMADGAMAVVKLASS